MDPTQKQEIKNIIMRMARTVFSFTVRTEKVDALDKALNELSAHLGSIAEQKAVEVCKRVSEIAKQGFEDFHKEIEAISVKVEEVQKTLATNGIYLKVGPVAERTAEIAKERAEAEAFIEDSANEVLKETE